MADFPRSLREFEQRFGEEGACIEYLAELRWPHGFACPGCGAGRAWRLATKPWTYECARCGRQTSVTAGTIMDHSKLPLTSWFWAAYVMATQPRGISALQLQHELSLGSYKTAWLLCAKLRRSMAASDWPALCGLVEVGTMAMTYRSASMRDGGQGRQGNLLVAGAVEVRELGLGRIRLSTVPDNSAESLRAFLAANLAPNATAKTEGWTDDCGAAGIVEEKPARIALPWIRRVFDDLEAWALGAYHGLHPEHLQSYLDEFVFRFNHRRTRDAAFPALLGIAAAHRPCGHARLVSQGANRDRIWQHTGRPRRRLEISRMDCEQTSAAPASCADWHDETADS